MSTEDGKVTPTDNGGQQQADAPRADESYTKHRIKRALEKAAPDIEARGRKTLLAELGVDPDDEGAIDSLKAIVAKGASADSERTKLQKQMQRLEQEREQATARAAELERSISMRAVRDTIAEAIGDAPIVPGTLPEIQTLLSGRFSALDGKVAVLDEHGEPANVAPRKLVADWLASHTHYLTATAPKGGAGSRSAGGEPRNGSPKRPTTDAERRAFFEEKLREGPSRS